MPLVSTQQKTDRWRGTEKLHTACEPPSAGKRQCECEIAKLITPSFVLSADFGKEFKQGCNLQ